MAEVAGGEPVLGTSPDWGPRMSGFPQLDRPPIHEVVTGFLFESMPHLTPVQHGVYWEKRRSSFAEHLLQPAVIEDASIDLDLLPVRTWLVSPDATRLIQLQHDRLFVNWRRLKETDEYPRFSRRGASDGLLHFSMSEYGALAGFCEHIGGRPKLTSVELSKIDAFVQGVHWSDVIDLADLLPPIAPALKLASTSTPALVLRVGEEMPDGLHSVLNISSAVDAASNKMVIRVETWARHLVVAEGDLEQVLVRLNSRLNEQFFALIPAEALARFRQGARA